MSLYGDIIVYISALRKWSFKKESSQICVAVKFRAHLNDIVFFFFLKRKDAQEGNYFFFAKISHFAKLYNAIEMRNKMLRIVNFTQWPFNL